MRKRQWLAGAAAIILLLVASGTAALAAEPPDSPSPHRAVYGSFIIDTDAWPDRAGDSWYCSLLEIGCSGAPQRPMDGNDVPVAHLLGGQQAGIACYSGSYYLTQYSDAGNVAWVDKQDIAIPSYEQSPQQCTAFDGAT